MNDLTSCTRFFHPLSKSFAKQSAVLPNYINQNGWLAFQFGLFFLPSSAFLAVCLFLPALIFSNASRPDLLWKDHWNIPFFVVSLLMICGAINAYTGWLAVVGLGNWLPFFWMFIFAQPYLSTGKARARAAFCLVAGTLPVFVTGFGQLWWGWSGPWNLLGGLIVWFLPPGGQPIGRLSGLFDYANIAGAWLALVWPFSLALLLQVRINRLQRAVAFTFVVFIVIAAALTDSRNAWGGLVLALPFVIGPMRWYWLLPLLGCLLLPVVFASLSFFPPQLQDLSRRLVPESIWSRLSDLRYGDSRILASTRIRQWQMALQIISERPLLGWGAAAFSVLYPLKTGQWHGHAHNLPLDLAVSHGLPVAVIFVGTVVALLITTLKRGVLLKGVSSSCDIGEKIFDRAWWTSSFVLLAMHGTDMPFFDSRINIAGWILLSGLRCMLINVNDQKITSSLTLNDVQ